MLLGAIFSVQATELKTNISCHELQKNKLITFFNQEIKDKIIKVTPDFCLSSSNARDEDRAFNKTFNQLKQEALKHNKATLKENEAFYILKSLMLSKLWNSLSNQERHQTFGIYGCNEPPELYLGFMDFSKENREGSPENFKTYTHICRSKNPQELLPFLDKGLTLEYFLVVNLAKLNFESHQKNLCNLITNHEPRYILGSKSFDTKFNFEQFKKNINWMFKTNFYETLDSIKAVDEFAQNHLVPAPLKKAILFYTSNRGYKKINTCLRGSKPCKLSEVEKIKKGLSMIKKRELITFRGVGSLPFSISRQLQEGCLFKDSAFLSTSLEFDLARDFAVNKELSSNEPGYLFVIRGKSGAIIQNISDAKFEKEVLYPNLTRFVVTKDPELSSSGYSHYNLVFLREIEANETARDCNN